MAPTTEPAKELDAATLKVLARRPPIVVSGPSGAGKSTMLTKLQKEFPGKFEVCVSHTSRNKRPVRVNEDGTAEMEQHGVHYFFISKDEFKKMIDNNDFIEHAQFGSNYYGTSIQAVKDIVEKDKICILDIEMEGVKQVANHPKFPRPRFLFLSPPSMEVLEQRLRGRATDSEEAIQKRLAQAKKEMEFARSKEAPHEKIVVNDDEATAYQEVKDFIKKVEEEAAEAAAKAEAAEAHGTM